MTAPLNRTPPIGCFVRPSTVLLLLAAVTAFMYLAIDSAKERPSKTVTRPCTTSIPFPTGMIGPDGHSSSITFDCTETVKLGGSSDQAGPRTLIPFGVIFWTMGIFFRRWATEGVDPRATRLERLRYSLRLKDRSAAWPVLLIVGAALFVRGLILLS